MVKEHRGNGDGGREVEGLMIMDSESLPVKVLLCSVFISEDAIELAAVEVRWVRSE